MKEIGLGLAGLGLLYLTRRKMTLELGRLVRRLGGGDRAFLIVWSAIFLPGTIIHEVSHFLAAALTGARTGRVEIFPELPRKTLGEDKGNQGNKGGHRLGFVETQRLGPVRGFLVGTAPLLVGLGILVGISSTLEISDFRFYPPSLAIRLQELFVHGSWRVLWRAGISDLLKLYLFFTVANSLFLSWADVKQALPLAVIAGIFGGGMYFLGIRPEIVPDSRLVMLLTSLWKTVWISAGVNLVGIILLAGVNRLIISARSRKENSILTFM